MGGGTTTTKGTTKDHQGQRATKGKGRNKTDRPQGRGQRANKRHHDASTNNKPENPTAKGKGGGTTTTRSKNTYYHNKIKEHLLKTTKDKGASKKGHQKKEGPETTKDNTQYR